jgi:hypothetical protein
MNELVRYFLPNQLSRLLIFDIAEQAQIPILEINQSERAGDYQLSRLPGSLLMPFAR